MIYEEAVSVNEEYQSKNEELMASKEELQSLNEELNALNSQLQETLERQRTTANDLQNVLYSTDVATIFLDTRFNIRFFTPATKALFNVIPGDVGRPLTDLKSLAPDVDLLSDARTVLKSQTPIEREVAGQSGAWFMRRILPYRTRDKKTEGVVITFADITERRTTAQALTAAKSQAEQASTAKSRFLAAASHDLRQPLQTLALLQGLLASKVTGEKEQKLVGRMEEALGAMTNMLNALLDINQIEVGAVKVETADFPLNDLFDRLRDELTFHAQSQGLTLKVMPCRLIDSQRPASLGADGAQSPVERAQIYAARSCSARLPASPGKIADRDSGIRGSASRRPNSMRYSRNITRLTIRRASAAEALAWGSPSSRAFATCSGIRFGCARCPARDRCSRSKSRWRQAARRRRRCPISPARRRLRRPTATRSARILIVEDDPEVREYLALFLNEQGYNSLVAIDGPSALALLARRRAAPDLVIADYNLPNGLTGVEVSQRLRAELDLTIPVVILTGDISTSALRDIALHDCVQFSKPVKLRELSQAIAKLLAKPLAPPVEAGPSFAKVQGLRRRR